MKLRKLFTLIAFAHIGISLSAISNLAVAESAKEIAQEEVEKGPNNGRVLRQGDLAIELAIYETGTLPNFVYTLVMQDSEYQLKTLKCT